jgi:hypothetical protein
MKSDFCRCAVCPGTGVLALLSRGADPFHPVVLKACAVLGGIPPSLRAKGFFEKTETEREKTVTSRHNVST